MWQDAFLTSAQSITYALLCRSVLAAGAKPFERVSAAIAVRAALAAKSAEQTFLFLVPRAAVTTARHIVSGLLVGHYGHSNGGNNLPPDEVRALFRGSLLFITQSGTDALRELSLLQIAGNQRLSDIWEITTLSKYQAGKTTKPRVFVTNQGWALRHLRGRRFGAVVIDASQPRCAAVLPELLSAATDCTSIRIVVTHPLAERLLRQCGYPNHAAVWFWDPQAAADAFPVAETPGGSSAVLPDRNLLLCDGDTEVDAALGDVQAKLADVIQQSAGRPYAGLAQAIGLFNRLRQLCVPLSQLEEVAITTWAGGLRKRVEALAEVSDFGNVIWELTWQELRGSIEKAYQLLLRRQEPAKFWVIASRVSKLLSASAPPVRVVVSTQAEVEVLTSMLQMMLDDVKPAIADGRLQLVTAALDERLVAEGQFARTILAGQRRAAQSYLDLYPVNAVDEVLYPFEVAASQRQWERFYAFAESLQREQSRLALLELCGLIPSSRAQPQANSNRPQSTIVDGEGREVRRILASQVSGTLDLDELAETLAPLGIGSAVEDDPAGVSADGDVVDVTFAGGIRHRYYNNQKVDVFFQSTGVIQREPALALKAGWQVIGLVDDQYASLFERLSDAVASRLSQRERFALELWRHAKERLLGTATSKRALYETLCASGLTSTYEAFASWFREDDEATLAPQQFSEFAIIAKRISAYNNPALLQQAFECVQHHRGRNRAAGRALQKLLRAIVSGDGYEAAIESARSIDSAMADVLGAVEILEVQSVQLVERRH